MIFRKCRILYAMSVHSEHRSGQSKKECSYPVPSIFDTIFCGFTPSVRMFIGQGLSLEARRAAQAERRSANTATTPASVGGGCGGGRAGFVSVSGHIQRRQCAASAALALPTPPGVRRERRILIFFATKSLVCFVGGDSAGAASNNKPTRGRLREGRRYTCPPAEAVSLQD